MFAYLRRPPGFYRRVFLLALPVVLQNLITTSLAFMDTFMVGLLGSEEMAAVTVANTPLFVMQLLLFGIQSGLRRAHQPIPGQAPNLAPPLMGRGFPAQCAALQCGARAAARKIPLFW